jgi:hypothetical protein
MFDSTLPIAEDQDLWIRLARLGPIGFVQEVLARVHDTPGSVTKRLTTKGVTCAMELIERHVETAHADLSAAEIRGIYAERCASLGRNAYEAGDTLLGLRLLLRAIGFGAPTLSTTAYLLSASLGRQLTKRRAIAKLSN